MEFLSKTLERVYTRINFSVLNVSNSLDRSKFAALLDDYRINAISNVGELLRVQCGIKSLFVEGNNDFADNLVGITDSNYLSVLEQLLGLFKVNLNVLLVSVETLQMFSATDLDTMNIKGLFKSSYEETQLTTMGYFNSSSFGCSSGGSGHYTVYANRMVNSINKILSLVVRITNCIHHFVLHKDIKDAEVFFVNVYRKLDEITSSMECIDSRVYTLLVGNG